MSQLLPIAAVLALGGLILVVVACVPRLALVGWLIVICAVPVWAGVTVIVDLQPQVLASVGLTVGLLPAALARRRRGALRVMWADGLFAAFVVASLVGAVDGRATVSDVFVLVVEWTSPYLVGRLIGYRVPVRWVYRAVAVAFMAVAVLALVEFVTGWNPFVHVPGSGLLYDAWSPIQERGGRARAEGAFGHSIALGACLAMAVPIGLAAPLRAGVRLPLALLLVAACAVTFSRIGLLTAVFGVLLTVVFLPSALSVRLRWTVVGGLVGVALSFFSLLTGVFTAAGAEATESADYRLDLLTLLPTLRPFGLADSLYFLPTGDRSFGSFASIDNALLLVGLAYGWVPLLLVLSMLGTGVWCLLSGRVTAPTVALVAQIPAFATVALITQYSALVWFIAGLAVFSQSVPGPSGSTRAERPACLPQMTPDHRLPVRTGPSPEVGDPAGDSHSWRYGGESSEAFVVDVDRSGRILVAMLKFLAVLRRRARLVVAVLLLCVVGGGTMSMFAPRSYESTSELYFSVRSAASGYDLAQGGTFTREQMASFASLARTPRVLTPVAQELGIAGGASAVAGRLTVKASETTVVLTLTVTDTDPRRAAEIAAAVADQTIDVVAELAPADPEGGGPAVRASVVTPATVPSSPSSPDIVLNLAASAVLGLALGTLAALGREALDTRILDAQVLAELSGRPLIGTIGRWTAGNVDRVAIAAAPHSPAAETFRQLRTNLQFLRVAEDTAGKGHVVSITSSLAGEGKSTVASNLAAALAETGARVLLVDADLRRPSVGDFLGVESAVGLTTVLTGQAELEDVVQEWGEAGLRVLPSGAVPPNPTELLASPAMRRLLDELRQRYEHVIVDTAPLLPVADAAVLSQLVDGTIVVARAGRVRRAQLAQALANLDQVSAPVLGLVLNSVVRDEMSYSYEQRESPSRDGATRSDGDDRQNSPVPIA